jgi:hypothetical protein
MANFQAIIKHFPTEFFKTSSLVATKEKLLFHFARHFTRRV